MKSSTLVTAEVLILIALLVVAACGCATTTQNATTSANQTIGGITLPTTTGPPTPAEARQIAAAAYVYGYPLVLMDLTKDRQTAAPAPTSDGTAAPVNQFARACTMCNASFTTVPSPNADALFSFAWLNLTKEPMVLSVPNTTGRFCVMELLDGWTNVFASPGTRTIGTDPGNFAIVGPGWNGTLPAGLTKIEAPTETVWIAGRTQLNGPGDLPAASALLAQYKLTPLTAWGTTYTPPTNEPVNPNVDTKTPPVDLVANMTPATFYGKMATLMVANPPNTADKPVVDQMARIGLAPGTPFDWNGFNSTIQDAIAQGAKDGLAYVPPAGRGLPDAVRVDGWVFSYNLGKYGTNYTTRARAAWEGIGANLPEDALYQASRTDANGTLYNGAHEYVMHFAKNSTPPVNAFWSLTMYNDQQLFVDNPINRYAISPHLGPLKYNADGSLDIYIQRASPGSDKESNWLPAPSGGFNLMLRMYWPQESVLNGSWVPPAVLQVG
ncbi:MAG: DUF1254 domain-containing protein [Halobacteriota archaeon]